MKTAIAFACALVVATLPARAFVRETTSTGTGLFWPRSAFPITYYIDSTPAGDGGAANISIVEQQFAQWAAASCAEVSITTSPGTIAHASATAAFDGKSEIYWTATWPPSNCPTCSSAVLGLTSPWYDDSTGQISEADMQFNAMNFPKWESESQYDGCAASSSGCSDTASICLHEEGHFLGLGHTPISSAVMYASWDGNPKRQLTSDDLSGICTIYPKQMPGTGAQGSGCVMTSDCVSGLQCATPSAGGGSICTKSCTGTSDMSCPTGDTCQAITTSTFGCFPPAASSSGGGSAAMLGQTCGSTVGCEAGLVCASDAGSNNYTCEKSCMSNANPNGCMASQICESFTTGSGGACVDNPNYGASIGQSCANIVCQSTLVCFGPDPNDSYCRAPCTPGGANTCTGGLSCIATGNGAGVCASAPILACDACDTADPCASGLSCVVFSAATDLCRKGCSTDSDCPSGTQCIPASSFISSPGICSCSRDNGATADGNPCVADQFCVMGDVCVADLMPSGDVCRPSCEVGSETCGAGLICKQFGSEGACVDASEPQNVDAGPTAASDGGTRGVSDGGGTALASGAGCGCSAGDPAGLGAFVWALGAMCRRRRARPTANQA